MRQRRIALDAFQLVSDNLFHVGFDPIVVFLYHLFHAVVALLVREIGNDGNLLVGFLLLLDLFGVHDDFTVENLLFDPFIERIGHGADEHSLRQRGDFRGRDERIHLRIDGCGFVVAVDRDALPSLQDLSEAFGERLGRFAYHLTGKDIADGIHHDFRLLIAVIAH